MEQFLAQHFEQLQTPAFVFDERQLDDNAKRAAEAIGDGDTRLLFAMKSFSVAGGLQRIARTVDGLHASSLFEAKLARSVMGERGVVHLTTPGLRADEFDELSGLCDYISFNSLGQWQTYRHRVHDGVAYGLRVNPQLSFVKDHRYDPCRDHSKLGVPLDRLRETFQQTPEVLAGISGLLIHTNCDAEDFHPLLATVRHLEASVGPLLERLSWINLGGGYLFDRTNDFAPLHEAIHLLRTHKLEILFEPGAAISRSAGYLVTRVIDLFENAGTQIAILDTSVNHMPEAFEYQFKPELMGASADGDHRYLLAGATCLAGDLFGEYAFDTPLRIGSRLVFNDAGAYTMVKASMFNGVNLPSIYALTEYAELELKKTFGYDDFLSRCGAA